MLAYIYQITDTVNDKVNIEKLDLEIRASTVPDFLTPPYMFSNKIYVEISQELAPADKTTLDGIIAAHDGATANVSEVHVVEREKKIRQLTEMAIYHPALNESDTVEYLTSIDNWFNSWKRSGVDSVLVAKIVADATGGGHPQDAFLNTVVNAEGNKTFEFLISVIQS